MIAVLAILLVTGLAWFAMRRWALRLRERSASELKTFQDRLAFALQSARMGTWDLDLENRTVACSKEMLELWGIDPETFDGRRATLQEKVHPEDRGRMNVAIDEAILRDGLYELEYRVRTTPGTERWVASRGRCYYGADSRTPVRLSGVIYDVTDRKAKEDELRVAIQTRDQFISIASHELKTPLTGLQLLIQLRQRDLKRDFPGAFTADRLESWLNDQYEYVRRMTYLINNILDVARISDGRLRLQRQDFDLSEMVSDVIARFRDTAEAHSVEIRFDSGHPIRGSWDRFRLEQVLLNLLTNAVRYGNKKPVLAKVEREGPHALITVLDQGLGISAQDQARIFDRFERAVSENEVSGLGLGLYISREIVQEHGGEIRLKSEPGRGSEFTVFLPGIRDS